MVRTNVYRSRKVARQRRILPFLGGLRLVVRALQGNADAAEGHGAGIKQRGADDDRSRRTLVNLVHKRELPLFGAIRDLETDQSLGGQEDQLTILARSLQNGRRIAGRVAAALPGDLAAVLLERDNRRSFAADVDEDLVAIDDGRAGHAEEQVLGLELLEGVDAPLLLAVGGVAARQNARRAKGVDLAISDGRRGAGA